MSERIAPSVFESDTEAQNPLAELWSAGFTQSPWLAFGIAALFVALALAMEEERIWLVGVAGIAMILGVIDWVGGSEWD
jgi:hypothetical protein